MPGYNHVLSHFAGPTPDTTGSIWPVLGNCSRKVGSSRCVSAVDSLRCICAESPCELCTAVPAMVRRPFVRQLGGGGEGGDGMESTHSHARWREASAAKSWRNCPDVGPFPHLSCRTAQGPNHSLSSSPVSVPRRRDRGPVAEPRKRGSVINDGQEGLSPPRSCVPTYIVRSGPAGRSSPPHGSLAFGSWRFCSMML